MTELIAQVLIGVGLAFDAFGIIGLVRLPDIYNRVQASTKCVTLGTCMILFGVFVYSFSLGSLAMGVKALVCLDIADSRHDRNTRHLPGVDMAEAANVFAVVEIT